jgi:hypothetical protein
VDAKDHNGDTRFLAAVRGGHVYMVKPFLLNLDLIGNNPHKDLEKGLLIATERGHLKVAELLLNAGANVNAVDEDGKTPLHAASVVSSPALVKLLLAEGANVNAVNTKKETPFSVAKEFLEYLEIDRHDMGFGRRFRLASSTKRIAARKEPEASKGTSGTVNPVGNRKRTAGSLDPSMGHAAKAKLRRAEKGADQGPSRE